MRKLSVHSIGVPLFVLALTLTLALPSTAAAQSTTAPAGAVLPGTFLKGKIPHMGQSQTVSQNDGPSKRANNKALANAGVPNIDSVANWTGQFSAPGFDSNGNPQSEWPFEMVGAPPESGQTTVIRAPVVPVTVQLLDAQGRTAMFNGHPLVQTVSAQMVSDTVNSPVYQPWAYTSGIGQFNDQMLRAEFWDRFHNGNHDNGWHTLLAPSVKRTRVMQIPAGHYSFSPNADGTCCAFVLIDEQTFGNLLFPPTFPIDNSTPVGAAELAGDITTRDISTFLFNNVYLYSGTPSNCCILGFHSYDFEPGTKQNGNRERRYVMMYASWITNGLFLFGFEDVAALSHEMSETFNDPFVDNATPWWLSIDAFTGGGLCQNNLETGDVVEVLTTNAVFPISTNGRTYHLQNEALFPWFAFQSPSTAHLGAYTFPDETTITSLSQSNLLPGCVPGP